MRCLGFCDRGVQVETVATWRQGLLGSWVKSINEQMVIVAVGNDSHVTYVYRTWRALLVNR